MELRVILDQRSSTIGGVQSWTMSNRWSNVVISFTADVACQVLGRSRLQRLLRGKMLLKP